MSKLTNLEIAKACGAEVGTWDKSGNGGNVVSFTIKNFNEFVEEIRSEPNERDNIRASLNSENAILTQKINDLKSALEDATGSEWWIEKADHKLCAKVHELLKD
jgi:hypothetical protein